MSLRTFLSATAVALVALPGVAAATPTINIAGVVLPVGDARADGSVTVILPAADPALPLPPAPLESADLAGLDFSAIQVFGQVSTISVDGNAPFTWVALDNNADLTYSLGDISVNSVALDGTINPSILIELSGTVTYKVDNINTGTQFDGTLASATDGTDFLQATFSNETFDLQLNNGVISATETIDFEVVPGFGFSENFGTNFGTFSFQTEEFGANIVEVIAGLNAGINQTGSTDTALTVISEPGTLGLMGASLLGMGFVARRRKA